MVETQNHNLDSDGNKIAWYFFLKSYNINSHIMAWYNIVNNRGSCEIKKVIEYDYIVSEYNDFEYSRSYTQLP